MTPLPKNQKGFTLVELLVALTLLTIGLLAVAGMQTVALNKGGISYKISSATYLARQAMDDIMSWDVNNANLNTSVANVVYANNVSVQGGGTFNISYTTTANPIIPPATTNAVGLTMIVVTVRDVNNGIQPVTLTSYKKVV